MTSVLSKKDYLSNKNVQDFIDYLADVIQGKKEINHQTLVRDKKVPDGYVKELNIKYLRDGFEGYFWNKEDYSGNIKKLEIIRSELRAGKSAEDCAAAIEACMIWGLGEKRSSTKKNVKWAEEQGGNLPRLINQAIEIIESDDPNVCEFRNSLKMNSGYTKVYALISDNSIIYDGRVGAALGLLVRRFRGENNFEPGDFPDELRFPWGSGESGRLRNPNKMEPELNDIFPKLGHGKKGSYEHALWNIRANWVIEAALERFLNSDIVGWGEGGDRLRKIEAALFMLGYDLKKSS